MEWIVTVFWLALIGAVVFYVIRNFPGNTRLK